MVNAYATYHLIKNDWNTPLSFHKNVLSKPHTGMLIFGPDQESYYDFFVNNYPGKILFISQPAVNMSPDHGTYPRNVLVIFTNETSEKTHSMPDVRIPWQGLKWG